MLKKMLSCLLISFIFTQTSLAQSSASNDEFIEESKDNLLIVVAAGIAGAILGLSTLSFVEEPKKHTKNIIIGASLGIIAGVGVVTYTQANKSRELFYDDGTQVKSSIKVFDTYARNSWHYTEHSSSNTNDYQNLPLQFHYTFTY